MLHEIVDIDDDEEAGPKLVNRQENLLIERANSETLIEEEEKKQGVINKKDDDKDVLLKPGQRLEVVKITRCKMRQRDTLEIEIGLKNLQGKQKLFEERQFVLKFLDKLDPQLACKGRILLLGSDITKLQQMQFKEEKQSQQLGHNNVNQSVMSDVH